MASLKNIKKSLKNKVKRQVNEVSEEQKIKPDSLDKSPFEQNTSIQINMKDYDTMMKAFPHSQIRDIQEMAIEESYNKLKEKKFIILELPPGSGKSAIGWTLANAFKDGYFITIQKMLQDQYVREMSDKLTILKGQNAYQCAFHEEYTCEESSCSVQKSIRKSHYGQCPYTTAVNNAIKANFTMFNIHSFYFQSMFGYFSGIKRSVMVIDEAHNIENSFMSIIETSLTQGEYIQEIPNYSTVKEYQPFLKEALSNISKKIKDSGIADYEEDNNSEINPDELKRINKMMKLENKLQILINDIETSEWVFTIDSTSRGQQRITFKPLYVHDLVKNSLFKVADKFILMSATIGSFSQFCSSIGIDKDDACIIRGPSPFPIQNRPIYYQGCGSMGQKKFEETFPKVVEKIKQILRERSNEKGIIQSHSEWLAARLDRELNSEFGNRITVKNGDMIKMLDEHGKKDNSVMISAGTSTGLDLKDDLARFQIIVKMPYPSLGDKQIKRRFELSNDYYSYLTALTLMQTYGRGIRHETDFAATYILDSDFGRFLHFNRKMLSEWFLEAIVRDE